MSFPDADRSPLAWYDHITQHVLVAGVVGAWVGQIRLYTEPFSLAPAPESFFLILSLSTVVFYPVLVCDSGSDFSMKPFPPILVVGSDVAVVVP